MLYGRDAERSAVTALLDAARDSRGGVLGLRGQAGAGKSARLPDAVEQASDMQVLEARGIESEAELAFAGLHQLLRPILGGQVEGLPGPQATALRAAFGLEHGRGDDRFLVSVAVLSLLAEAAERRPVLCVVDDAHWLDEASANALVFVARRLEAEGVVLLFAARDGDPRRFAAIGLPTLEIGGLDGVAVAALLAERAAVPVAPQVRDRLLERTGGNPLALVELPSVLTSDQLSGVQPLPLRLPLTDGVEHAFLERVRRLPDDAQALLLIAAAEDTGRQATVTATAATLGAGLAALDAAEAAGLGRARPAGGARAGRGRRASLGPGRLRGGVLGTGARGHAHRRPGHAWAAAGGGGRARLGRRPTRPDRRPAGGGTATGDRAPAPRRCGPAARLVPAERRLGGRRPADPGPGGPGRRAGRPRASPQDPGRRRRGGLAGGRPERRRRPEPSRSSPRTSRQRPRPLLRRPDRWVPGLPGGRPGGCGPPAHRRHQAGRAPGGPQPAVAGRPPRLLC